MGTGITCQSLPRTEANVCDGAWFFFETAEDAGAAAAALLLFSLSSLHPKT